MLGVLLKAGARNEQPAVIGAQIKRGIKLSRHITLGSVIGGGSGIIIVENLWNFVFHAQYHTPIG